MKSEIPPGMSLLTRGYTAQPQRVMANRIGHTHVSEERMNEIHFSLAHTHLRLIRCSTFRGVLCLPAHVHALHRIVTLAERRLKGYCTYQEAQQRKRWYPVSRMQ